MTLWLLLLALGGTPDLGTPVSRQQSDGSWKCSAACFTGGRDDGGLCRTPIVSHLATKDACEADLKARCAKTKPPPGGCRWGSQHPADSK